jgi:hypothetical protein
MTVDFNALARQVASGKGSALRQWLDGMVTLDERTDFLRKLCAANEEIRKHNPEQKKLKLEVIVQAADRRSLMFGQGIYTDLWQEPGIPLVGILLSRRLYTEFLKITENGQITCESDYLD